jgi:hypothetical protein
MMAENSHFESFQTINLLQAQGGATESKNCLLLASSERQSVALNTCSMKSTAFKKLGGTQSTSRQSTNSFAVLKASR